MGTGDPETKLVLNLFVLAETAGEMLKVEAYAQAVGATRSALIVLESPEVEPG